MCSYWGRDRQETGTRWLNLTGAACSPSCITALRQQRSCRALVSVSAEFCSWPLHSAATCLLNTPNSGQLQDWDWWWMKYMTKTQCPQCQKEHVCVWEDVHSVCPFSDPCPLCADNNSVKDMLRSKHHPDTWDVFRMKRLGKFWWNRHPERIGGLTNLKTRLEFALLYWIWAIWRQLYS